MPGTSPESAQYLKLFTSQPEKFAVLKVGGAVVQEELNTLVSSLAFLVKVGLYPIIIHGGGPQLNEALKQAGIEPQYVEGLRVTDPETLSIALEVFQEENSKIVRALENKGVRSRPIISGVFEATPLDPETYGFVGEVCNVKTDLITSSIKAQAVPVVTSVGYTRTGQALNINADVAARTLAVKMQPLKVVYLNTTGGMVHGESGEVIPTINLKEEYEYYLNQPWMKYGARLKLKEMKSILDGLPATSSLAITKPQDLLKELFTRAGAGTIIRQGEAIHVMSSPEEIDQRVDKPRLCTLLEDAFSGKISSNYLERLSSEDISRVYVSESYNAAGVFFNVDIDGEKVIYMDKFAVAKSVQGEGKGELLWARITADVPKMFWRSRTSNPINSWYFNESDGSLKSGDWIVFWYGFDDFKSVVPCIEYALNLPSSMSKTTENLNVATISSVPSAQSTTPLYQQSASFSSVSQPTPAPKPQWLPYSSDSRNAQKRRIALVGARGYTGAEFMKLVFNHPYLEFAAVSSRQALGKPVSSAVDSAPDQLMFTNIEPVDCLRVADELDVDAWVLALPNGAAGEYVSALTQPGVRTSTILDISSDYRFSDDWVYGLPEINAKHIEGSIFISNPGCYATGSQLSLHPILQDLVPSNAPHIFGISGYSGAGSTPSDKNDPKVLSDNIVPYAQIGHTHEREISHQLNTAVCFLPHVAPFFRGITLSISFTVARATTSDKLYEHYRKYFAVSPLVHVVRDIPQVKHNAGKHHVKIGGFHVSKDGHRVVLNTTLDNLLKGAATQAIQNLNLAFGFPEYTAIPLNEA